MRAVRWSVVSWDWDWGLTTNGYKGTFWLSKCSVAWIVAMAVHSHFTATLLLVHSKMDRFNGMLK